MKIDTISLIISSCVSLALCVASFIRNFRDKLCIYFGLLCAVLFAHDVVAIFGFDGEKIHTILTLLITPCLMLLLRELLKSRSLPISHAVTVLLWASPVALGVSLMLMAFKNYPQVALIHDHLSHILFVLPAWVWLHSLGKAQNEVNLNRERLRLRFSFWGGCFTAIFFVTNALHYSGIFSVAVPPLGTLARTVYLVYLFQTFIQKELVTVEELVTKIAHFGGIALLLSSLYVLLVSWVSTQEGLFYFNTFIASFMIIVLFDPLRSLSTRLVRQVFLGRHLLLEKELNEVSDILRGVVEPSEIALRLKKAIEKSLGTEKTTLYILDRDGFSFVQIAGGQSAVIHEFASTSPLIEYMSMRRGRPFVLESIENDRDFFRSKKPFRFCEQCVEAMRTLQADLIIPFMEGAKPLGFLAVQTGERVILSNEQLRLFLPLARQVGQSLKNNEVFNQITDREKLMALGEMAAGIAHEIKNPLGAIKGAAQLLQGSGAATSANTSQQEEFLKIIIDETERLSGVLSDFLDYAKPRRTQIAISFDPLRVIENAISIMDPTLKVNYDVSSDAPVFVQGDPEQLKQVLVNLFLNASQAMEGGTEPKIRVRVKAQRSKSAFALVEGLPLFKIWEGWTSPPQAGNSFVAIEVSDNGAGIRPEDMERIFVPFYTTKTKGTGLGLAICQRIIESMGGSIHVKPNYPRGTTFTLHLPLAQEEVLKTSRSLVEQNI